MTKNKTKLLSLFLCFCMVLGFLSGNPMSVKAVDMPAKLLIAMVYGCNVDENNVPATSVGASRSFVEIYNPNSFEVSLDGYYLYYQGLQPSSSASRPESWDKLALTTTNSIPAHCSYLVVCNEAATLNSTYTTVADGDQVWNLDVCTKGVKFLLRYSDGTDGNDGNITKDVVNPFDIDDNGTQIGGYIDMFGGAGDSKLIDGCETAFLGGSSKQKGFVRTDRNSDTDNNFTDFSVVSLNVSSLDGVTTPRNLASGVYTSTINVTSEIADDARNKICVSLDKACDELAIDDITVTKDEEPLLGCTLTKVDSKSYEITLTESAASVNHYTLTISDKTGFTFTGTAVTNNVTSDDTTPITEDMIADVSEQLFKGAPIEPHVSVTSGATTLIKDSDYTLSYTNNVNVGTATVIVSAVAGSEYSGSASKTFEITSVLPDTYGTMLTYLGSYSVGVQNADGGVAEIVKYNKDNKKMYIVSGEMQSVDIVSLAGVRASTVGTYTCENRVDIGAMGVEHGFATGDITSVDINTRLKVIVISVQHSDFTQNGSIVFMDYNGAYIAHYTVGNQPDMVGSTPDGNYVMTADEGEPRDGYDGGATDPMGSVTIVDLRAVTSHNDLKALAADKVTTVTFESFDAQRDQLVADGVLLKTGADPSRDLEPEYIAFSADSTTAYVSLQEANAIATFNIATKNFTAIKGLGFKDFSVAGNELDLNANASINIQNEDVCGVYMPDGVATVEIGGVAYVLTPNEGDAREWGSYSDVASKNINGSTKKVEYIKNAEREILKDNLDTTYIYGARSFSIWNASDMTQVYDSGSDFERITAEVLPTIFNATHKENGMEGRSNKKGPEPEDIKTLQVGSKYYAFIGLERIGGVMMYNITSPSTPIFVDYFNKRDPQENSLTAGELGAEGISVVSAQYSPNGYPLVLVANEVSGTVTVLQINEGYTAPASGNTGGSHNSGSSVSSNLPNSSVSAVNTSGTTVTTEVTPTVSLDGTATAAVTQSQMSAALLAAQQVNKANADKAIVEIKAKGVSGASAVAVTVPAASVHSLATGGVDGLTVSTDLGSLTFSAEALVAISQEVSGDVRVTVAYADISSLSAADRAVVGNRPVYDFSVTSGGSTISQFGGPVTVALPYTPSPGEDINAITVFYVKADGTLELVINGRYDAATGKVIFSTTHFSIYAVGYKKVSFADVSATDWYANAVSFLAARGITSGTTKTMFSPDAQLTRGQFITLLLRAYNVEADATAADNFSDAGDTYYTGYLAVAKKMGISSGIGDNKFAPEQIVTRQEICTLLYNALKEIKQLPEGVSTKTILDFTDAASIDTWARDAMTYLVKTGAISGSDRKLDPKGPATRAQMAQILYKLLSK